ncbi:MAG: TRAP transporter large permease [Planctomycetaceae bacterium]|nr:TRAP transporter large permease [Planctomycetaceae bacterium]
MLAGDLMLQGGISSRLVELGRAIFGHMTGSLAIITVFCCAIFAALSGSGPATVAAIGGIMIPAMVDEKYEPGFAATIAATSGCLGPIIPPSIVFAVYGVSCSVSISDLFMAGFIPGLLLAFSLAVFSYIIAKRYNFGVKRQRQTVRQSLTATKNAIWALIAPMIILGGIYGGICTPTEAAVIACSYAFIVGLFIYREIRMGQLFEIFSRSALTAGTCLILLGGANAFGRILTLEQMPVHLYNFLTSVTESRIVVFLLVNLLLFTVGMFMETLAAVVILAPLLLTIVKEFGMSPLHFGVILTMNLTVGMCTPPVGVNLFIASGKAKCTLESMFKWLVPATAIMMVVVLFFTFCEPAITFFPQLLR